MSEFQNFSESFADYIRLAFAMIPDHGDVGIDRCVIMNFSIPPGGGTPDLNANIGRRLGARENSSSAGTNQRVRRHRRQVATTQTSRGNIGEQQTLPTLTRVINAEPANFPAGSHNN